MSTPPFCCARCGHRWGGLSVCHCTGCCQPGHGELSTFSGLALFDRHRAARGEHGACLNPASIRDRSGHEVMWVPERHVWRGPERDEESLAKITGRVA